MQSIGCCFDTGITFFPSAASLTISVTFLKSGNAIVDSLECTNIPFTDTSNDPRNTQNCFVTDKVSLLYQAAEQESPLKN
jgi:hypothetical protein